jgi:hemerythrin
VKEPLYIVWNKSQCIKVPIIDDQHHAIVSTINTLFFFINQGWGLSALTPTLKVIKTNIGFHLKTEEGILEKLGANHKIMQKHCELNDAFNLNANKALNEAIVEQEPMILLKFLRDWWLQHHLKDHTEYHQHLKSIEVREAYE